MPYITAVNTMAFTAGHQPNGQHNVSRGCLAMDRTHQHQTNSRGVGQPGDQGIDALQARRLPLSPVSGPNGRAGYPVVASDHLAGQAKDSQLLAQWGGSGGIE